jgi:tetratricopeptide (TPR) repeat protein
VSKLVVFRGTRPERYVDLTDRDLRIGRAADNDIVLDDPDRTVSRFHAELRYENGRFVLIDLNSQNGLWMDGQRMPRLALEPGRPVTVGMFRLLLEEDGGRVATAAPTDATIMVSDVAAAAAGEPQTLDGAALTTNPQPPPPASAAIPAPAPAPARAQAAPAPKKAAAPKPKPPQGEQVSIISKIARPKVMLSVIGLMLLLLVARMLLDSGEAPPAQQTQTTTPSQPQETNEQLIARHVADGKAKMASGDYDGAIEAFQRALIIDQESPEALELKIKAEEAKRAQPAPAEAQAATEAAPATEPPKAAEPPPAQAATQPPTSAARTTPRPARRTSTKPPALTPAQRDLQQRYAAAKGALERGRYAEAAAGFDAILQLQPGYEDAAVQLAKARTAQKAQAAEAVQSGRQLAQSGNLLGARDAYLRARTLDPAVPGLDGALASLTEQMRDAGQQAYRKARQYDAVGRGGDAIPLYQQAVQYLPDSDPNKKVAQDRLAALRGGQ